MKTSKCAQIHACLLGGAIGDALGAAVEFDKLEAIRARFGADGLTDFAEVYGRVGAITDDTQMTLFTAEGLIRAHVRRHQRGQCDPVAVMHHAYLRWLLTQGEQPNVALAGTSWPDGWLMHEPRLFTPRAPGMTCLSALRSARAFGERAKNDSKGCGTVMRVAPIGLAQGDANAAFELGVDSSALTHAHPTGHLAGGAFAGLIHHLAHGASLREAIDTTRAHVATKPHAEETTRAIDAAVELASSDTAATPEAVESLGGGWIAEEALAISLYCALRARSFEHGVLLAVNHGGDSDSTGSMTGQILGLQLGLEAIPERWRSRVELADLLETIAIDLTAVRDGTFDLQRNAERYPGW